VDYLSIMAGLVGLFLGGEALVRGSVSIAHKMSISPFVIGLTVVGFGTSTPELLVSVQAALKGVPDIAIGNIVGSNIANVLLIVGVTALVWPIHVAGSALRRDTTIMILSALALVPLFAMGEIGRVAGLTLVAGLIAYLVWTFLKPRQEASDDEAEAAATPIVNALLWVALGLVGLLFGARFLVDGAVSVAQDFGVSEAFIGLTIVAIGTSLPELATSLIAAFRHQSDIAIGNIVGSNIFNVLGILGVTSIVAPIPVAPRFLTFDLPIMIVVSIVLTGLLLLHQKIGRRTGAVMLLAYCAYLLTAH
jgi:cation:H+ antiporter